MKILVAVLVLLITAGMNTVFAQDEYEVNANDSIYGLDVLVSKRSMNLSFYSTYKIDEIKYMYVKVNDNSLPDDPIMIKYVCDNGIFKNPYYFGIVSIQNISEYLYKINIENLDNQIAIITPQVEFWLQVYLIGESDSDQSENLRSSSIWQSNTLTFFFEPLSTSLNEIMIDNGNYIYNYYLLSGKESKEMPVGVPFIQIVYNNGDLVRIDKRIQIEK